MECTGSASGLGSAMSLVKPKGTIILKTTVANRETIDLNPLVIDEVSLIGSRCGPFEPAIRALEKRSVDVKPLISRMFSLEEGAEAFHYASKKGILKVLLRM